MHPELKLFKTESFREKNLMDPRIGKYADILVNYSTGVKKNEIVIIECFDSVPQDMIDALIEYVYKAGGRPIVWLSKEAVLCKLLSGADKEIIKLYAEQELPIMRKASAYIAVRAYENVYEKAAVPRDKMELYKKYYYESVHMQERLRNTKWVVTRWPTASMAQRAKMSTKDFENFYFQACVEIDYKKMSKNMDPLVSIIEKTDRIRIIGPETNLNFSVKNIAVKKCDGRRNIPDGEVFTAPVKDSVNGTIKFNTSATEDGKTFSGIHLTFKNGKVVDFKCESGNSNALKNILDADEGARYVGEFALGLNPFITKDFGETIFDEKIAGSFHLALGNSYKDAYNGNESQIHWDLICIQTKERGGGQIYFDGVLIRNDGLFVLPELKALNP
jgi:aminopeptidase